MSIKIVGETFFSDQQFCIKYLENIQAGTGLGLGIVSLVSVHPKRNGTRSFSTDNDCSGWLGIFRMTQKLGF